MDTPAIVPADVAWMLVATALVLLMTPALGVLLRRARALEERPQHHDDERRRRSASWASPGRSLGYSLAFAPGSALIGDLSRAFLNGRRARAAGHDPPHPVHGLPGHVRDHHRRAHLGGDRRAHALPALPRLHHALEHRRLRARSRTGSGAAASSPRWARSTSRAAPSCTSTPATAALVAALVLGPRKDYARQAILPHNVPFMLLGAGPAVVRLVRLQRRQRARGQRSRRLAFVNTMLAPAAHARGLDARSTSRATARRPRWARRPAIVVGLVAITPAAGFVSPLGGARARRVRGVPELLRAAAARAHAPGRLARRRGRARRRRHGGRAAHRCPRHRRPGTAPSTGCSTATPASSGSRPSPCWRRIAYSAVATLRAAEARRPRDRRCGRERTRRGPRPRRQPARRGGLRATATARSWSCSAARRQRSRGPALTAAAAEGGRA